ncbi:replicative DNA helicase [Desulfuribacillus alkaliarsenatis]|uniref:Replicative DNA helicase n=1 Tax=Desulfuribacillus alkaliarsenatis TaxID=766136 RepID=A0A1E5G3U2_9FIRM|nr:replicative DNA helicase [Desulfuribacillus alkaliarsenatis]OEF97339.1 replicative DNA helicase [Desulfuribacillus alkaliarsenatis]
MDELIYDRVPPHHVEAEQAVLGSILLDNNALITVSEFLQPEDFYRKNHEIIYRAAIDIYEKNEPVDLVTLTTHLQSKQLIEAAGGITYLTELANGVPSAANAEFYARKIEEKAILRRLIGAANEISKKGYDGGDEIAELLDLAESKIFEVSQRKMGKAFAEIKDVLMDTFNRIEKLHSQRGEVTGLPTGYTELDRLTSGFQKSDLIIIAARPSVGKTAFALNVAQNIGIHSKVPVAIFSLEMSKDQLVQRMLCAEANIDANRLRTGNLQEDDWPKMTMAMGRLADAPIFIDDSANLTVLEMRAKLRRLQAEHGLGLVLIDYLQLLNSHRRSDNRQQEISEISRGLKGLARELDVPVIALSQLSRAVESRQDKRPMMSDIRESGSIEQDADIVGFLFREDYYDKETEKQNIIEIIIAKQRNGPVGSAELVFLKQFNKFVNLDRNH